MQVLVVDDMASMRLLIKSVLRQMGFVHIAEASDGAGAVRHLTAAPVDLLICDWNMPVMTGLEVLVYVREQLKRATLPVIMVTAEHSKEQVRGALHAGVNGYVVKPFTPARLITQIDQCLAKLV